MYNIIRISELHRIRAIYIQISLEYGQTETLVVERGIIMANLNERMVTLGTQRSVIRELFEFGKKRAAEIGAENVFDFSIGNPSVPSRNR